MSGLRRRAPPDNPFSRAAAHGGSRLCTPRLLVRALTLCACSLGLWAYYRELQGPNRSESSFGRGSAQLDTDYLVGMYSKDPPHAISLPRAPASWVATSKAASQTFNDTRYQVNPHPADCQDRSPRCLVSGICDRHAGSERVGTVPLATIHSTAARQAAIKVAMDNSWKAYRKHAWGHDELAISARGQLGYYDWLGCGLSIVDSLDTLLIMGMTQEYQEARDWVINHLRPGYLPTQPVSVFEINIRIIGGLLSVFALGGGTDAAVLKKAQDIADSLLIAFDTYTGVPRVFTHLVNRGSWADRLTRSGVRNVGQTNVAAAGTFSLELATLTRLTGNPKYIQASNRFWSRLGQLDSWDGLYCTWFDADFMSSRNCELSFGASSDSFYEYMLKQWIMTGGRDKVMLKHYKQAIAGMRKHLVMEVNQVPKNKSRVSSPGPEHTCTWDKPLWLVGIAQYSSAATLSLFTQPEHLSARHLQQAGGAQEAAGSNQGDGTGTGRERVAAAQEPARRLMHTAAPGQPGGSTAQDPVAGSDLPSEREGPAGGRYDPRLQHFTCFVPGLLTLGHVYGVNSSVIAPPDHDDVLKSQSSPLFMNEAKTDLSHLSQRPPASLYDDDLLLAAKLMRGCYEMYRQSMTGVAGDIMEWVRGQAVSSPDDKGPPPAPGYIPVFVDSKNYLRPEVVESLLYLWRATKDEVYREWGWLIFTAFHEASRLPNGAYSTLEGASGQGARPGDRQESFWLAETLKYLYLLFSDDPDLLPFDQWVFNTEAHPLPIWTSAAEQRILSAAKIKPFMFK